MLNAPSYDEAADVQDELRIASETGLKVNAVHHVLQHRIKEVISLDAPARDDSGESVSGVIPDERCECQEMMDSEDLAAVRQRTVRFVLMMLCAVWMHLAVEERRSAMTFLAALLGPGGLIALSLRHGPVPAGRAMFEVSADETIALARACGLRTVACDVGAPSLQAANAQAGVVWSKLAFVREDAASQ